MIVIVPEESLETVRYSSGLTLTVYLRCSRLPMITRRAEPPLQKSTFSSISGKRSSEREEQYVEKACSHSISDEQGVENARKKLWLSKDQSAILEESFKDNNTLNPKQKDGSGKEIGSEATASGSMVPEKKGKDEIEANGGGLRVPQEMLRKVDCSGVTH